jgi:hypothetical protein
MLASVGCTASEDEQVGTALGAAGEGDAGDGGLAPGTLIITAVYPMGGRTGATLAHDYVEILNKSSKAQPLDGYSLQLSTTGTSAFTIAVPLTGTVAAGGYFLVELGSGGPAGDPVMNPDQPSTADSPQIGESTSANARAAGHIALAVGTTALNCGGLGASCPSSKLQDLVGWGATSYFEGAASAPKFDDATKALARAGNGCADTNNNSKDFALADPAPRNKDTAAVNCTPPKPEAGVDANSIPKPINEPDPGNESPYDAGQKPDSGVGGASGGGASDDGCSVSSAGARGMAPFAPLTGIALGVLYALRRRRRS